MSAEGVPPNKLSAYKWLVRSELTTNHLLSLLHATLRMLACVIPRKMLYSRRVVAAGAAEDGAEADAEVEAESGEELGGEADGRAGEEVEAEAAADEDLRGTSRAAERAIAIGEW